MLQTIMEFTDEIIYPAFEAEWAGLAMPKPIIELLEIGNVILPPHVLNVSRPISQVERLAAESSLMQADLFKSKLLCDWYRKSSQQFPATASYISHLDLLRRLCLDSLMKEVNSRQ